jgi:glycosyltransferase involved in cell wall biosynthesis
MAEPALSFVVPLYNSATTIGALARDIEALQVAGGHEIVLVNDGSTDVTAAVCSELVRDARMPVVYVEHTRNFGEHNAVLTGWRHARGRHFINLDDDGQNPPAEALKLWKHAVDSGLDVVFGCYGVKQHSTWRNAGSAFTGKLTDWVLDKPKGLYLSSFRCVTSSVAREASRYAGPHPYIDGLLLQVTQRVGSIEVRHLPRSGGGSGYTIHSLLRLWLSAWINFSILPLRAGTLLGIIVAAVGLLGLVWIFALWLTDRGPPQGWGWLMSSMLVFSGVQLVMLGLVGEYLGRMFLAVNQKPQSVVRKVDRSRDPSSTTEPAAIEPHDR